MSPATRHSLNIIWVIYIILSFVQNEYYLHNYSLRYLKPEPSVKASYVYSVSAVIQLKLT
jgi:hypothetical protein